MFITAARCKATPDYCSFISVRLLSLGYGAVSVSDAIQQTRSMGMALSSA